MAATERGTGFYSKLEIESADERLDRKWSAMRALVQKGWEKSGEFRARMEKAGLEPADIKGLEDWDKIPTFSKKDLIGFQQEKGLAGMLSCAIGELGRVYMSPGPIFDPEAREDDYWGWTEGFYAAGFRENDLVQMTFSYHLTPAGLMLEEPLRKIGCAVIPAGPGNTGVQIELMTGLPVTGFVGMASYLKIIKDKAREQGMDISKAFKLKTAFVAAERLAPSLRRELEQELGILVRQGYGTADVGCIAYECPELSGMHLSSRCWVEICEPGTGKPLPVGQAGEVVVTPFTSAYPIIRLATGDLSVLRSEECACGRTSLRLEGILGRVDLTTKVKGQFIYPHQAAEVAAGFPEIARWRLVVDNPGGKDRLRLQVELAPGVELDEKKFTAAFQEKLKLRPLIETVGQGVIPDDAPPLEDKRVFE